MSFADPKLNSTRVSLPLLVRDLEGAGRQQDAVSLRELHKVFRPGEDDRVIVGADVDLFDTDVLNACPGLSLQKVRQFSYPVVFYKYFRSAVVHEYELKTPATPWPDDDRAVGPSYANFLLYNAPGTSERRIHFPVRWLSAVVESIAASIDAQGTLLKQNRPAKWWADG